MPHEELLPTVDLVIGHGGHGTTMRALSHGVPVLVVPMSSLADHHLVADAVVAAGAGAQVAKAAETDELQRVIAGALADASLVDGAGRIAALLGARSAAGAAVDAMEVAPGQARRRGLPDGLSMVAEIVCGLLVRDGQALLVHRTPDRAVFPGVWDFPGGHVEPDETGPAALVRELAEELGIVIASPPATRTWCSKTKDGTCGSGW